MCGVTAAAEGTSNVQRSLLQCDMHKIAASSHWPIKEFVDAHKELMRNGATRFETDEVLDAEAAASAAAEAQRIDGTGVQGVRSVMGGAATDVGNDSAVWGRLLLSMQRA